MRRHVVDTVEVAELVGLDCFSAVCAKESREFDCRLHRFTLSDLLAVSVWHRWETMASDFMVPLSGQRAMNLAPIIAGPGRVGSGQCFQQARGRLEPAAGVVQVGSGRGRGSVGAQVPGAAVRRRHQAAIDAECDRGH